MPRVPSFPPTPIILFYVMHLLMPCILVGVYLSNLLHSLFIPIATPLLNIYILLLSILVLVHLHVLLLFFLLLMLGVLVLLVTIHFVLLFIYFALIYVIFVFLLSLSSSLIEDLPLLFFLMFHNYF